MIPRTARAACPRAGGSRCRPGSSRRRVPCAARSHRPPAPQCLAVRVGGGADEPYRRRTAHRAGQSPGEPGAGAAAQGQGDCQQHCRQAEGRRWRYRPSAAGSCCAPAATPRRTRYRPLRPGGSGPARAPSCPMRTRARWPGRPGHQDTTATPGSCVPSSRKVRQSHFLMATDSLEGFRAEGGIEPARFGKSGRLGSSPSR